MSCTEKVFQPLLMYVFLLLMMACKTSNSTETPIQFETSGVSLDQKDLNLIKTDTAKIDSTFNIGNYGKFRFVSIAYELEDSLMRPEKQQEEEEKINPLYFKNRQYSLSLWQNGKLLFNKSFTYQDLLADSLIFLDEYYLEPIQLQYILPAKQVLILGLDLNLPETDIGERYAMVYDFEGNRKFFDYHTSFHGGCTSDAYLSSDENFFLTCSSIYNIKENRKVEFDYADVGAYFLNDSFILLINDFESNEHFIDEGGVTKYITDRDTVSPNAKIFSIKGDTLGKFLYKGIYQTLGYSISECTEAQQNTNYFMMLDVPQHKLVSIEKRNPANIRFHSLDSLKTNYIGNHQKFKFTNCDSEYDGSYEFYVDKTGKPVSLKSKMP